MKIDLGKWRSMLGYGAFAHERDVPLFVQFSGGRTSAMMTCLAPDEATICFENTGREHEKTLEFVRNVGDALGREVVWLEFRPPERSGLAPNFFHWERISFNTAARKGEPFVSFMESINAYRKECGNPPIEPWARQRICTTYLKHRVLDHYLRDRGVRAHDRWIGLRADEPHRVAGLRRQETANKHLLAPLYVGGVSKADVDAFWSRQSFDLGIPPELGNCDGCFLKDQSDVSRALGANPEAIDYWQSMQDRWPRFGGEGRIPYRVLAEELPVRLAMEEHFRTGKPLSAESTGRMHARRFRLVMAQERKRFQFGPSQFSCACETSMEGDEDS